jgi:hypothetical protein
MVHVPVLPPPPPTSAAACDDGGLTALDVARAMGRGAVVEALVARGGPAQGGHR